jgi:hypothetical protein
MPWGWDGIHAVSIMPGDATSANHPWHGRYRPDGLDHSVCYSIKRLRKASATAAVRSDAPSFSKMCSRWVLTVSGEM